MPQYANVSGFLPYMNLGDYKRLLSPEMADVLAYIRQTNSLPSAQLPDLSGILNNSKPIIELASKANNVNAATQLGNQLAEAAETAETAGSGLNLAGLADKALPIAGAVTTGAELIGNAINTGKGKFTQEALEEFNKEQASLSSDFAKQAGQATTTSDIIGLAGRQPDFLGNVDNIDTMEGNVGNSLSSIAKGATAGAAFGPLGGIIGGAAGFLIDSIGQIVGIEGDYARKEKARETAKLLEDSTASALNTGNRQVSNIGYRQGMANFLNNAAMGGPLSTHGADFSDGLIRIDVGGTHEQNPYGGVPAGVDPQGIPNLVEEGETIWDDYVFSDRLKVPKSLTKKLGLGGSKKGITYADASKKIAENSGVELRPNDPISKRTEEAQLAELEVSQEEKRMKLEKNKLMKAISEMNPDELQGLFAAAQEQQMPMETQVPPQGVNEESLGAEPVQGTGEYEPVGFAFGGHILDGKHGTSKRVTKELAGPYRFPGVSVLAWDKYNYGDTIPIEPDKDGKHWWVGGGNGVGRRVDSEAEAKRLAEQMANARASLNAAEELTEPAVVTAKNPIDIRFPEQTVEGVQVNHKGQVLPNEEYNIKGQGRFLPNDYGSYFGRIPAPGREPGWFARSMMGDDSVTTQPTSQQTTTSTPTGTTKTKGTGTKKAIQATAPKLAAVTINNTPLEIADSMPEVLASLADNDTATQKAVAEALETPVGITGQQDYKLLPTWMRYAPIVGGALSVLSDAFNPGDYSDYDRLISSSRRLFNPITIPVETIGDRIRRNPFDEKLAVNQANQNFLASLRGTMDTAGGNRAYRQFANNLLAYNNQGALSEIARNAYLANRQDALQTADFNRATGIQNMNAINQRNLTQAELNDEREQMGWSALAHAIQMKDAAQRYDDQMASADFTGLMQSLGNLGKENEQRNWLTSLGKEGVLAYLLNNRGGIDFIPQATTAKCGGKMKTKKRRF